MTETETGLGLTRAEIISRLRSYGNNVGTFFEAANMLERDGTALSASREQPRLPAPEEVEAMIGRLLKWKWPGQGSDLIPIVRDTIALLRRLAAPATGAGEWQPTHRHYKGGLYRVIARGRIEFDLEPVVIYDNAEGETWVRPVDDFEGWLTTADRPAYRRFEPLPAPSSISDTEGKP